MLNHWSAGRVGSQLYQYRKKKFSISHINKHGLQCEPSASDIHRSVKNCDQNCTKHCPRAIHNILIIQFMNEFDRQSHPVPYSIELSCIEKDLQLKIII